MERVIAYLEARRPELGPLDEHRDLIEDRVLDSLHFVEFLYLLEEITGEEIALDSVDAADFRTIAALRARFFDGR